MRAALPFACLALAGCMAVPEPAAPRYTLSPIETGLSVDGTGKEIGFGRAAEGLLPTMSNIKGVPNMSGTPACQVWSWNDGLQMHIVNGAFQGYVALGGTTQGDLCL